MEKNNRKFINAWCSYDIANSSYNLIITTVIFPLYYGMVTKTAFHGDIITVFGFSLKNSVAYDYTIALAYLVVVFISPILSGIADYTSFRKGFMRFFTYMGATVCALLYFFNGSNIEFGLFMAFLAVIGYAGSLVFYNSFLPLISTPDRMDNISARGFSWGYAGSVVLLLISFIVIKTYTFWGFEKPLQAIRFSFLEVGIWWFSIAHIALFILREPKSAEKHNKQIIIKGYSELMQVFKSFTHKPNMYRFIVAFFFWSMGVQTVMLMATFFGSQELKIPSDELLPALIIIQLIGIIGATFFAFISRKYGSKLSLSIMILLWIAVCIAAYFIQTTIQFYVLAFFVGMVMGGIQSQSRSAFAKMIPQDTTDTASYFSFYDVTEKMAIVIGMFSYGLIGHITGSMRFSALALTGFFMLGFVMLMFVRFEKKGITS